MRTRSQLGSAMSEFGPAIFLLFVFGFLPVVDFIAMGMNYASAYYLNELQLREAQKVPRSSCIDTNGSVILTIPQSWRNSMLGGLADNDKAVTSQISYQPVPWVPVGSTQTVNLWFVSINTTVSFRPLFAIPFFKGIPGLSAPYSVVVGGRRPVENNRFLNS